MQEEAGQTLASGVVVGEAGAGVVRGAGGGDSLGIESSH